MATKRIQTFVLAALSIVASVNAQAATCDRFYTVQPGDICDSICAAQNVSTFQLQSVNAAIIDPACDNLQVGEVLCLGLTGHDCKDVHVIVPGDTCFSIATQANITVNQLLASNPNVNATCGNIFPGEVLCVGPAN